MGFLLLGIPFVTGLAVRQRAETSFILFLLLLYFYGFVYLTALTSSTFAIPGTLIPSNIVNATRGAIHIVMLLAGAAWLGGQKKKDALIANGVFLSFATMAIFGQVVSELANNNLFSSDNIIRLAVNVIYFINIFVFIYSAMNLSDRDSFIKTFSEAYISIAFGLGIVVLIVTFLYGDYSEWAVRLGRPLNPGVFSGLIFPAFACALFITRNSLMTLYFAGLIVASGSRTALACMAFAFVTKLGLKFRHMLLLGLMLAVGVVLFVDPTTLLNHMPHASLYTRSEWSAGRLVLWLRVIHMLPSKWIFGTGGRFEFFISDLGRDQRLHNGVLEGLISYGIIFTIAAFSFYGFMAWQAFVSKKFRRTQRDDYYYCFRVIVIYAIIEFFFGTMYWTNLGDPFSLAILMFAQIFLTQGRKIVDVAQKAENLASPHPPDPPQGAAIDRVDWRLS